MGRRFAERAEYDGWGDPVRFVDRNEAVTTQERDERGRLARRASPTGTVEYVYDDADRLVSATTGTVTPVTTRFAYEGAERVPSEK